MDDVTLSQDIWKSLMIYVIAAAYSAGAIKCLNRDDPLRMDVTVTVAPSTPTESYHGWVICEDKETLPCLVGFAFSPLPHLTQSL